MKKRILSGFSLILLLCILLSSCAAGLPGNALYSTAKDKIEDFKENVNILLDGKVTVISGGKSNFAIEKSPTASQQVRDAITNFSNAILSKTGVDLSDVNTTDTPYRIRIGNTISTDTTQPTALLHAATFRITFLENDLVIEATNDLMIASALHYITETYVNAENANIGEGYFYLPRALFYSPTATLCESSSYTIIRSETIAPATLSIISSFHNSLMEKASVRLSLKSDLVPSSDENAFEILIGSPNHPQAKDILQTLDYNEYYIGTCGNKILILATNNQMLQRAVNDFLNCFLYAQDAVIDTKEKTVLLPSYCYNRYTLSTRLLAENGTSNTFITYPEDASTRITDAIGDLQSLFVALTNSVLEAYTDAQRPITGANHTEILIGDTGRRLSVQAAEDLAPGDWTYSFIENSLVVSAKGETALLLAIRALQSELIAQAQICAEEDIYTDYGALITGENRTLYFPTDIAKYDRTAPTPLSLSGWVPLNGSSYMAYTEDCDITAFSAYLTDLTSVGFTEQNATQSGNVSSAVYLTDTLTVTVSYSSTDRTLRVIVDRRDEIPDAPEAGSATGTTEPFYAQLSNIFSQANYGMSHVARLCDGTFVIINGGSTSQYETELLLNFLKENNTLAGKPVISCWIFTDATSYSLGAFNTMARRYAKEVTLRSVLYSFPSDAQTTTGNAQSLSYAMRAFEQNVTAFGEGIPLYRAHTGAKYAFAGCEIEVLLTLEDHATDCKVSSSDLNNAGISLRMTLSKNGNNETSILILGNLSDESANLLHARYGEALHSDVVQVMGTQNLTASTAERLYASVAAPVVLWSAAATSTRGVAYYDDANWASATRSMLRQDYAKVCYVACRGTVTLTLDQLSAGTVGRVFANGLFAANAATSTTETPSDAR